MQVVIIVLGLRIVWSIKNGAIKPVARKGKILIGFGIVYLLSMSARLIVGLTIMPDHFWFSAMLPALFHMVLAAFLIVYGRFHSVLSRESVEIEKEDLG